MIIKFKDIEYTFLYDIEDDIQQIDSVLLLTHNYKYKDYINEIRKDIINKLDSFKRIDEVKDYNKINIFIIICEGIKDMNYLIDNFRINGHFNFDDIDGNAFEKINFKYIDFEKIKLIE